MASRFNLVFAVLLMLQLLDFCRGKVGVAYGKDANNLPTPDKVTQLFKKHNIQFLRIYDSDPDVLKALANTGFELMVGVHNSDLSAFQSQSYVDSWLNDRIRPFYPGTKITHITVGNEVTETDYANLVVPAMRNVVSALKRANLQDQIKVSTPLSFGVLSKSFPPSEGAFQSNLESVLRPLLDFLDENDSPFMVNLYPYNAIGSSPLEYILFESTPPVQDPNTGFMYNNMFDAQLDAVYNAIVNQNFGLTRNVPDAQLDDVHSSLANQKTPPKIVVTETGWPTRGHQHAGNEIAQTYNSNLIRHVTGGSGTPAMPSEVVHVMDGSGTPAMPAGELDVYIFSLFDENLKGSEVEGSWGIFNPDMTSKYNLDFLGK